MKKSVGILTFHASHNYGSMLQAHALQQAVINLGHDCEIINFRTRRQKRLYPRPSVRDPFFMLKLAKVFPGYKKALSIKYNLFEDFLHSDCRLAAKEYSSLDELQKWPPAYDCYISGSDQIWNTACFDFDWAYFLPFGSNVRRIAYAPSMGAFPDYDVPCDNAVRISSLLCSYDFVSVREQGTADRLRAFTGESYPLMPDPTMLMTSSYWEDVAGNTPLVNGRYIFLYSPNYNKAVFDAAKVVSDKTGMRIVVSQANRQQLEQWGEDKSFIYSVESGPKEFLNLCRHAYAVIGYSFHLAVFSILFRKPFHILNGMRDSRVHDLLVSTGFEARSFTSVRNLELIGHDMDDFSSTIEQIAILRQKGISWLDAALE